jgi:hypothetical protein
MKVKMGLKGWHHRPWAGSSRQLKHTGVTEQGHVSHLCSAGNLLKAGGMDETRGQIAREEAEQKGLISLPDTEDRLTHKTKSQDNKMNE